MYTRLFTNDMMIYRVWMMMILEGGKLTTHRFGESTAVLAGNSPFDIGF